MDHGGIPEKVQRHMETLDRLVANVTEPRRATFVTMGGRRVTLSQQPGQLTVLEMDGERMHPDELTAIGRARTWHMAVPEGYTQLASSLRTDWEVQCLMLDGIDAMPILNQQPVSAEWERARANENDYDWATEEYIPHPGE